MNKFFLAVLLLVSLGSVANAAPNISVTVDGATYQCGGNGGGNTNCWEACNRYTTNFDYCAGKCGGGSQCWQTCNKYTTNFDYCANKCGAGNAPSRTEFKANKVDATQLELRASLSTLEMREPTR